MKRRNILAGVCTAALTVLGSLPAAAQTGNGAPSGDHYNLNIIGSKGSKAPKMTGSNRHTIFVELNSRVVRTDRSIEETLEVALRMLRMRRVLHEEPGGFTVSPRNRELVSYYANSIAHLLGPFRDRVMERDSLPLERFAAGVN